MLAIFALIFLGIAHADVIAPDYHPVEHTLYINNIDGFKDYQFFVYPTHYADEPSEAVAFMDSNKIPGFYKFAPDPHLYAVKKTDMENRNFEEYLLLAMKSRDAIGRIDSLPDTDPREKIETHYNVSMEGNELVLTEVEENGNGAKDVIINGDEDGAGDVIVDDGKTVHEPDYWMPAACLAIGMIIGYVAGKKL